jgi:predicted DNA-binding transcriptional regulator AlpA
MEETMMDTMNTKEVAEMIGVTRATVLNWLNRGDFAPALRLSPRVTVYRRADVLAWMESKLTNKH